jgi:hypothetical protein
MSTHDSVEYTLAAAVTSPAGTVTTVPYPTGRVQADYTGDNAATDAYLIINGNDRWTEAADNFDISYGASTITLTNKTGATWPIGTQITLGTARLAALAGVTALAGALTGTIDGTIADVAAVATAGGNTYADSAINTAITSVNLQHKELQAVLNNTVAKLNALITALQANGTIDAN